MSWGGRGMHAERMCWYARCRWAKGYRAELSSMTLGTTFVTIAAPAMRILLAGCVLQKLVVFRRADIQGYLVSGILRRLTRGERMCSEAWLLHGMSHRLGYRLLEAV